MCFALPAEGKCPAGSHSGCNGGSVGCQPPASCCQPDACTPPPAYCSDKEPIGCLPMGNRTCQMTCA